MATAVVMPQQGNTVETCTIVEWLKNRGESVKSGEVLCIVETDKAVFEIEAPAEGLMLDRYFDVGADVPILTTIAVIGEQGENIIQPESTASLPPPPDKTKNRQLEIDRTPPRADIHNDARLFISPRARNTAQRLDKKPQLLIGSGPLGRIIERDVLAAADDQQPTAAEHSFSSTRIEPTWYREADELPMTNIRRVIAERMLRSLQNTAQLTLQTCADATALVAFRQKLKSSPQSFGLTSITINDLLLCAVSRTLLQHPLLNSTFQNDRFWLFRKVHLGFAVDTPRGLMVPILKNAQDKNLKTISLEAKRLIVACLESRISPDDLNGGTFTVTNLGSLGVETFTPVLNPPQSATLGIGSIKLAPVEVDGQVQFQKQISLSLTIDHQIIDGATGAHFLQELAQAIAAIDLLVAF
ncbi:MAG: 2-oxo acid dehydrogenase subunit E2 [Calditrichaeota bacterium]|nr:MAG: 2-oxo acid dehydrogenase subunit E2 [Calditrichota bacterium]